MATENTVRAAKERFVSELDEAAKHCVEFPLHSLFKEALNVLDPIAVTPSMPLEINDLFADLSFLVKECRTLSEEQQRRLRQPQSRSINNDNNNRNKTPTTTPVLTFFGPLQQATKDYMRVHRLRRQLCKTIAAFRRIRRDMQTATNAWRAADFRRPGFRVDSFTHYSHFDEGRIYELRDKAQEIEAKLLSDEEGSDSAEEGHQVLKAVGIVGMAGAGKSTLARMVLHREAIRRHFHAFIWVSMSHDLEPDETPARFKFSIFDGVEKLSTGVTRDDDDDQSCSRLVHMNEEVQKPKTSVEVKTSSLSELKKRVQKHLHAHLEGKRYLMVLDNVSRTSALYTDLGWAKYRTTVPGGSLPRGSGGAIILTTREEQVAAWMVGIDNLYWMPQGLGAESCWNIFMDSITRKRLMGPQLQTSVKIMKDAVKESCMGRPWRAKMLAESLSYHLASAWFDRNVWKELHMRFDTFNLHVYRAAIDAAGILLQGYDGYGSGTVEFEPSNAMNPTVLFQPVLVLSGYFNVQEVAFQLSRLCFIEIIEVKLMLEAEPEPQPA